MYTGVVHGAVSLEADGGAGSDGGSLRGKVEGGVVASEVGAGDVGDLSKLTVVSASQNL